MNPMEKAWSLLKANPRMLDSEGQSVPPAVMNYHNLSQGMDPYGHGHFGDGDREHGVSRDIEAMREGNHPSYENDDDGHAQRMSERLGMSVDDYLRLVQREHLEEARMEAKDDTDGQMKDMTLYHDKPKQSIQRMPRPEETDVANIMDEDIRRLNPKMKNIGHSSGRV